MKMHEQWYAGVQKQFSGTRYWNVSMWDNNRQAGQLYYGTREEAQKALDHAYELWNGVKQYDPDGQRHELVDSVNGIGISMVCDRNTDDAQRIVGHIIRKRMVTDWETVEEE